MLQEMFREILPFVSLTYECGSATWYQGKIYQHFNSFAYTKDILPKLKELVNQYKEVKGFDELISPTDDDFQSSGLRTTSLVRMGFLAVLPGRRIVGSIGSISQSRRKRLLAALSKYLTQ